MEGPVAIVKSSSNEDLMHRQALSLNNLDKI